MLAKYILEAITDHMTKDEILAEISRAAADLELLDAHQVGEMLGVSRHTVRKHASEKEIGVMMHANGMRVYFPSDVETLRELVGLTGQRPRTQVMVKKMIKAREGGATLLEIANEFERSESYVCKLLKRAGHSR